MEYRNSLVRFDQSNRNEVSENVTNRDPFRRAPLDISHTLPRVVTFTIFYSHFCVYNIYTRHYAAV